VQLLGLMKKEERSVVLLCRQKCWKLLKVTAVYVRSLGTVLFHTHSAYEWMDSRSVSMCNEKLNYRSHRSGRE